MSAPATMPSGWRIEQAMSIADAVKRRLLADDPDLAADETMLRDMLDGETDAFDLMRRMVRFALDASSLADAADARATDLIARRDRFTRRAETARAAVFGMLDALGETKLTDAEFTATISAGRQGLVLTDEAALPDRLMRVTRSPDRAAIAAALKAGLAVSGAEISNGSPTLTIRKK